MSRNEKCYHWTKKLLKVLNSRFGSMEGGIAKVEDRLEKISTECRVIKKSKIWNQLRHKQ